MFELDAITQREALAEKPRPRFACCCTSKQTWHDVLRTKRPATLRTQMCNDRCQTRRTVHVMTAIDGDFDWLKKETQANAAFE